MEPWFGDREQLEGNTVTWWLGLQAFVQVTAFVSRYPNSPGDSDTRCGLWGCLEPRVAPQKVIGVLKTGTPQSTSPPPMGGHSKKTPARMPASSHAGAAGASPLDYLLLDWLFHRSPRVSPVLLHSQKVVAVAPDNTLPPSNEPHG